MKKNSLVGFFCTHARAPLRIASYLWLAEFSSRALSCTRTRPGWVAQGRSHQWSCSVSEICATTPKPPPKHRGKGQQKDCVLWGEISCYPGIKHSQHCQRDWKQLRRHSQVHQQPNTALRESWFYLSFLTSVPGLSINVFKWNELFPKVRFADLLDL